MTGNQKIAVILAGVLLVLVLLFAFAVWPTPYRHDTLDRGPVEIAVMTNRFTGEAWERYPTGKWKRVETERSPRDLLADSPYGQ